MAKLNTAELTKAMLAAFKGQLNAKWPGIRTYGEAEMKKMAQTLAMIEKLSAAGSITPEQARLYVEIQKNSVRMVVLTLEDMGLLAVEAAINAALGAVRKAVNTALGFALL